MEKKCKFKVGDVVVMKYKDILGNDTIGLFYVIYKEQFDNTMFCSRNFIALKITTQYQDKYKYYCEIDDALDGALNKQSRVCCSKPYLFSYENVIRYYYNSNNKLLKNVIKKYTEFQKETFRQLRYQYDYNKAILGS